MTEKVASVLGGHKCVARREAVRRSASRYAAFSTVPYSRLGLPLVAILGMIAPVAGATVNRAKTGLVEVVTVEYRFIPDRLVFRRDVVLSAACRQPRP